MVIRKGPIGDTINPKKISKEDTVTNVERDSLHKTLPHFRQKVDYKSDTYENKHFYDNSQTETDDCERNLDKEHKKEEDEEFKVYPSMINIIKE